MSLDLLVVGKKNQPFAIGRRVREPVIVFIAGHLFLAAAVWFHAPDLHEAAPVGIEIDVLSIRRVIGAIIQARRSGEAALVTARNGYGVDIEFTVALTAVGHGLSVGRPAMPVRWPQWRDLARLASCDREQINQRAALLRLIADHQLRAIGRNAVIVIATAGKA